MDEAAQPLRDALELVRRAPADLWPGFAPATVPTLIFDGDRTWLNGAMPEEAGWASSPSGWGWPGRHPALVANTAVRLPGGLTAAGVLLPSLGAVSAKRSARRLASLLVHEAFHVWQAANPSPAWEANELDALTYPAGNAEVLHARAEETACLSAALNRPDWEGDAVRALAWRAVRQSFLSDEHQGYERRMETKEGLAQFVESRFLSKIPALDPLAAASLGVRPWAYLSGAAYAFLLSRGTDGWQEEVVRGTPLDDILANLTGTSDRKPAANAALKEAAAHAAQAHTLRLTRLRQDFGALPGKSLRLTGEGLRVVGFDPLHVHLLSAERILHARYLLVEVDGGELEVLGGQALADGADLLCPLALTVATVPEPVLIGGRWSIRTDHLRADLPAAALREGPEGWTLWLE